MENIFQKEYNEKEHKQYIETLAEYAREKSYYEKRKTVFLTSNILSYFFNSWSAFTMSFAAFQLTKLLFDISWLSWTVSIVVLIGFEYLKRLASNEFFRIKFFENRTAFSWLLLLVGLFSLSAAGSMFGAKKGTNTLAPSFELLAQDSTLKAIEKDIAKLEKMNEGLAANKDANNITFYHSQSAIKENNKSLSLYRARKIELEKKLEGKNEVLTTEYKSEINWTGWILVSVTFIFDVCFFLMMWYKWHYRKRCWSEKGAIEKMNNADNEMITPITKTNNAVLNSLTKPITATHNVSNNNDNNVIETVGNVVITDTLSKDNVIKSQDNVYPLSLRQREDFETTDSYIDYLLDQRTKKQRTYNTHKSKLKNGKGNAVTNQKAMERNASHIHQIDLIMSIENVNK